VAINGVLRPGHIAIRVREMEPAVRHYTEVLGLIETARDAQNRVYLKAWDEHDHHSVVLRQTTDPGMDYMGWRVDSVSTLKKLAADVEGSGLASEMNWIPAGEHPMTGERFRFTIPTGHVMELFAEKEKVGNGMPTTNPDAWPDGLQGMAPSRFDHCLLYGDDLDASVRLFIEVLGFALTEQVVAGPEKLMIGAF
jgi:catechol 2,3-dioxygenase